MQTFLDELVENSPAAIFRLTTDGVLLACNNALATLLGYASPHDVVNQHASAICFSAPDLDTLISAVKAHQKLACYDIVLRCKDESPLYVTGSFSAYQNIQTGETYIDGVLIDMTERKKAETVFYESENRYRQIVESAQEGIWTIDEHEKTNFVNKKICEILEYNPEEMMGKELYDFMDEEGKLYAMACMERRRNGAKEKLDIRYVTKSGRNVWANINANPIFDVHGDYKGALAMVTDITERKQQEERLQKSEANLRTIFDNTDASYVLIDPELKVLSFNIVAQTNVGRQGNALEEGRNVIDYFPDERKAAVTTYIRKALDGENSVYEAPGTYPGGNVKWYEVKWIGIPGADGEICGVVFASNDITEKKLILLEHERVTADLLQRNKDLQQFNYIVSHNLRAPVANIMGLVTLFTSTEVDEDRREILLNGLSVSIKNLDGIIKDLSFILQVREQVSEKKESVYFQKLATDITTSISHLIQTEQAVLQYNFDEAESIFSIRSYVYSIFYNLILNSIKYRQAHAAPVIKISSTALSGYIELLFEDNGKGIDLVRNGRDLFGLYKRFDTIPEGKGIGLFMVKTQVEDLGGTISVQSKPGAGTIFRVVLPV